MNLGDAIGTLFWVTAGFASEANPLMAFVIKESPLAFVILKLMLVSMSVFLLWKLRSYNIAKIITVPLFIVYLCISIIHISALIKLSPYIFSGFGA